MGFLGHFTVMKTELVDALVENSVKGSKKIFLDLTFGGGGHTCELARKVPEAKVFSFDQDNDAIENGRVVLKEQGLDQRVTLIESNFIHLKDEVSKILENNPEYSIAGIMADIGVSSHQFDDPERGFSFRFDGPLDMRMDKDSEDLVSAKEIVNTYSEEDLADIFFKYGEEKLSRRIAKNIIEARSSKEITRTKELEEIVFLSYPKKWRHGRTHPATKVFQALRIYVNRELEFLDQIIPDAIDLLAPGGRFAVISFHSLEDRILKHKLREFHQEGIGKLIQRKPILPTEDEIKMNPRSRSAKLRGIEKN